MQEEVKAANICWVVRLLIKMTKTTIILPKAVTSFSWLRYPKQLRGDASSVVEHKVSPNGSHDP